MRARLFHLYFLIKRPMTLGVRAVVIDEAANAVFLIRHTYVPGWHLPGGGVERGETVHEALVHELLEEGNIELTGVPELRSVHHNTRSSRRDHVVFFVVRHWRQSAPRLPDLEIAEAGFFALDALPELTTPSTRQRLKEVFGGAPPSPDW